MQRLRGHAYLQDAAIKAGELTLEGRHIQAVDRLSWHVLTINQNETVTGCLRYLEHRADLAYSDLGLSHSPLAGSPYWGPMVRDAVEAELFHAWRRGFACVELGGWAVLEAFRGGPEAFQMILTAYALAGLRGGAVAMTTATRRHKSSSILRRMGGRSLRIANAEVPPYYDPHYGCEMELLAFESTSPNERYTSLIEQHRRALLDCPLIVS